MGYLVILLYFSHLNESPSPPMGWWLSVWDWLLGCVLARPGGYLPGPGCLDPVRPLLEGGMDHGAQVYMSMTGSDPV